MNAAAVRQFLPPVLLAAVTLGGAVTPQPAMSPPPQTPIAVTGEGTIQHPERCGPQIHRGGNYQEGATRLMGKCERSVEPPRIRTEPGNRYLEFRTNGKSAEGNDRVELAHGPYRPFARTTYIGFRLRLPARAPVTTEGFYPLQLWQCAPLSPIAGVRVDRGSSHAINFMTRHRNRDTSVAARFRLTPGRWHRFVIAAKPDPHGAGQFDVWADGKRIAHWQGPYGSSETGACRGEPGRPPQHYRVKFGIYKGNEPHRYVTHFDDLRIGDSLADVMPPRLLGH
ncbi:heparin lyase I family protein [Cyanobium sp. ATX 6A2]|uniref:heparin lyase I family protein n=1 Tax=Cyanobium sp. ATX 6A2 TaxID=2823700 RepID=UPI0020CC8837|nr:heparin lyase I family protein [Cyanobium sp. ATX 6A2]MCP9888514.1 heparin lyase I family protein [Cyanobium sp. ATX 6A2]